MTKKKTFDKEQKRALLQHARVVIANFAKGLVPKDNPNPQDWWASGWTFFDGYTVRFTEDYLKAQPEFTRFAARTLKAKSAHEKTIRNLCQVAGQDYVKMTAAADQERQGPLDAAARALVETVLAEAGREVTHIEPNFLIRHTEPDALVLGRLRSMPTEVAVAHSPLSKHHRISLAIGKCPKVSFQEDSIAVDMPRSVRVTNVSATKENVAEEGKWLIDIAVSLMRLSTRKWQGNFPRIGDVEAHPIYSAILLRPHVTLEGDAAYTRHGEAPGWYEISQEVAAALNAPDIQTRASLLFDPKDKSLAQRVAQGFGWMTRGRQVSDRAERLLSLFTVLEALLTSNQENSPATETISRHVSVILTQVVKERVAFYNNLKRLYALRSRVVHSSRREVLRQDVNTLQVYVETVFWTVLDRCDLDIPQETFARSLADASHGSRWEFAAPEELRPAKN